MNKTATKRPPRQPRTASADWITRYAADPNEVRTFCRRHRLMHAGALVASMAEQNLHLEELRVTVEGDPEGSGEWLVFDFDMVGDVESVSAAYHRFKSMWWAKVELAPVRRAFVRLLFNIVEAHASK